MRIITSIALTLLLLITSAHAYGPPGHTAVGGIADRRLAGTPVAAEVSKLLDGLTLAEASIIPDKIRDWDRSGVTSKDTFHLPAYPRIEAALVAFWEANPPRQNNPKTRPSHHWFHYTDVPITGGEKYADGMIGRQEWDVVHMIPFCVRVLQGKEPEDNPRKITKPIALILLAHYVGDIHQPLHVGAAYFDAEGKLVRPVDENTSGHTQGGNTLLLVMPGAETQPAPFRPLTLHGYWDADAVASAFRQCFDQMESENALTGRPTQKLIAEYLSKKEPADWKPAAGSDPLSWAEAWANEMIPLAREAHDRLDFSDIKLRKDPHEVIAGGTARPRQMPDNITYDRWAGRVALRSIHRGGWRLAELIRVTLTK